jgi:hypothetical protein
MMPIQITDVGTNMFIARLEKTESEREYEVHRKVHKGCKSYGAQQMTIFSTMAPPKQEELGQTTKKSRVRTRA